MDSLRSKYSVGILLVCVVSLLQILNASGAPWPADSEEDNDEENVKWEVFRFKDPNSKKKERVGGAPCMLDAECKSKYCVYSDNSRANSVSLAHIQISVGGQQVSTYNLTQKSRSMPSVVGLDGQDPMDVNTLLQQLGFESPGYGYCAKECKAHPGYVGEGGVCKSDKQCGSGVCGDYVFAKFCSRECATQGYVAAGGLCRTDANCYSGVCERMDVGSKTKMCSSDSATMGKVGSSGKCRKDSDCYSGYCIPKEAQNKWRGLCSTVAPKPDNIGGGGPCRNDDECYSGWCLPPRLEIGVRAFGDEPNVCAAHSPVMNLIGEAGPCNKSSDCYSNLCVTNLTAGLVNKQLNSNTPNLLLGQSNIDQYMELLRSVNMPQADKPTQQVGKAKGFCAKSSSKEGRIGEGGYCTKDKQCKSLICVRIGDKNVCAKDSPMVGKVGSGGPCFRNRHCYSGKCSEIKASYNGVNATSKINHKRQARECSADSPMYGRIGGGGRCQTSSSCYSKRCYHLTVDEAGTKRGVCAAEAQKMDRDAKSRSETSELKNMDDFLAAAEEMMKRSGVKGSMDKLKERLEKIYAMRKAKKKHNYIRAVADGAPCLRNNDCASGKCQSYNNMKFCAKRSILDPSLIGQGGFCETDSDCASGFCASLAKLRKSKKESNKTDTYKFCAKEANSVGYVGGGGPCRINNDCASDYCVMLVENDDPNNFNDYALGFCSRDDPENSGYIGNGGPCKTNEQCSSHRCGRLHLLDSDSAPEFLKSMNKRQICLSSVDMDFI